MSHPEQMSFVRQLKIKLPMYFSNMKVLEIGSLNINGTIRIFFENCQYIGVDVGPGKNVDVICSGDEYDSSELFDTIASCECFEHNPKWIETFANMYRLCKPNGLIFMTCATEGRGEHGTTRSNPKDSPLTIANGWDYYKNLTETDFRNNFAIESMFSDFSFSVNKNTCDLYFYGIKK